MSTTKKVLLMILIGIIYFVFDTLLQAGYFKSVDNSFKGVEIERYSGIFGPEDMEWDRERNLIYISATDRRSVNKGEKAVGGIFLLHSNDKNAQPLIMKTDLATEFYPHGISVFRVETKTYLYTVNHTSKSNTVELFEIIGDFLKHKETYEGKLMTSPNDVVGDEVGKFYVTNDHGNTSEKGIIAENYLRMPYSYLLYYNGEEFIKAHKGMVYANGVQLSNDGTKLYTSHTTGHEVFVLDRKKSNGLLILKHTIDFGSGLDNIDVDENDVVWVAAHPKLFDFIAHAKDASVKSPSQFFRMDLVDKKYEVTKVYENDGSQISGSSVVVVKNDTAFVGCVFDDTILKLRID